MNDTNASEPKRAYRCPFDSDCSPYCKGSDCAIWDDVTDECGFRSIAKWLGEISVTLLEIAPPKKKWLPREK